MNVALCLCWGVLLLVLQGICDLAGTKLGKLQTSLVAAARAQGSMLQDMRAEVRAGQRCSSASHGMAWCYRTVTLRTTRTHHKGLHYSVPCVLQPLACVPCLLCICFSCILQY
jgi:hypothetical protein